MSVSLYWVLLIALTTAISASIVGLFLVVRKMSMLTDAISHTVLFGIVVAFMIVEDINSPLLILFAGLAGLLTAWLVELLVKTKRTTEDAATGVVFPLLFSLGILILSSHRFRRAHLCEANVFLGQLELSSFEQLQIAGHNIMPKYLFISLIVLLVNVIFIIVFFKELKIVSFDPALAAVLGISPVIIHYLLMALISVNAVTAFNAVGAIMVVALMVGPGATALLVTKDLKRTLIVTVLIAAINVTVGWIVGFSLASPMSGTIAVTTLVVFLLVLIFNPRNGIISTIARRRRLKTIYAILAIIMHIENHLRRDKTRLTLEHIQAGFNWSEAKFKRILKIALKSEVLKLTEDESLQLTEAGLLLKSRYL